MWLSVLFIGLMTLLPARGATYSTPTLCIVCGDVGGVDVVLNVLLFLPLGVGLALRSVSPVKAGLAVALFTLGIEVLQMKVIQGRDASLGDVVMNCLGGALGYLAGATRATWMHPSPRAAARLATGAAVFWLGLQGVGAIAVRPSFPELPWNGQTRQVLHGDPAFEHDISSVRLSGIALGEQRITTAAIGEAVLRGDPLRVDFVKHSGTGPTRTLYRIVDDQRNEVLSLGRHYYDITLRVRTGAADLRLRRLTFVQTEALPEDIPTGGPPGQSLVTARVLRDRIELSAVTGEYRREHVLRLSPSWTWVVVLPFPILMWSPFVTVGTCLWLGGLLVPMGYWCARVAPRSDRPDRTRLALVLCGIGAALIAGLWLLPMAFGLGASVPAEWIAALAGSAAGWWAARRRPAGAASSAAGTPGPAGSGAGDAADYRPFVSGHRLDG